MKRAGNLYPRIAAPDNLRAAFYKAARGKQVDAEVRAFRANFDANIAKLEHQLQTRQLDIGHYRFFTIRDPKVRQICAAAFPERVLHHAVMNVCEPFFEAAHIFDSYACREGKGSHRAVQRAQTFARRNSWFLKLDIRKYFDSLDHDVAMTLLRRRFKDNNLLLLFSQILQTFHTLPGRGVPIGNLFSQHLANLYLAPLDHWVKETRKVRCYLRYMDDFILFANNKNTLKNELEQIAVFLAQTAKLELKDNRQINQVVKGIPFLGMRIFPGHIRLQQSSIIRFSRKFRLCEKNYCEGVWSMARLVRHLNALFAFVQRSDSDSLRKVCMQRFGVMS